MKKIDRICARRSGRDLVAALLTGVSLAGATSLAAAQAVPNDSDTAWSLARLRAQIKQQEARLKQTELQLQQERAELERQGALLDSAMKNIRATGTGPVTAAANETGTAPVETANPTPAATPAQTSAPIVSSEPKLHQESKVLQTSPLQSVGGVLTPRGSFVIDPSLEYDYSAQNQLTLNGFTILPGITFGQLLIARRQQSLLTPALTLRYGVTNRLELSAKIPYVYGYSESVTQSVLQQNSSGTTVNVLAPSAHAAALGDIQVGASYQFNSGGPATPIFIGNAIFKTATGTSPFSMPIYTVNDPNGGILAGIQKEVPTGTGFYAIEPSLTVLYPTAPGIVFGNLLYIHNFGRTVDVQDPSGGPAISARARPGDAVAATFGIGFALNDQATFTLSYQQEHVFGASFNNAPVKGSAYDFGTFNFGVGYQISKSAMINVGVGIGAGPDAPAAKILVDMPIQF